MKNFTIINTTILAIIFATFGNIGHSLAMQQPLNKEQLNEQLIEAAGAGDTVKIKKLLDDGANLNAKNDFHSPITKAIISGQINSVKALLDAGVKPMNNINYRESALSFAIGVYANKHLNNMTIFKNILKEILSRVTPAQLNQIDSNGYTLLMKSRGRFKPADATLLLAAGADPFLETYINIYGVTTKATALDIVKMDKQKNMISFLENFFVTPEEIRNISAQVWALNQVHPRIYKDVVNAHIKPKLVQELAIAKMEKIKAALPLNEWAEIDKADLQKALEINIRRTLNAYFVKHQSTASLKPMDTSE